MTGPDRSRAATEEFLAVLSEASAFLDRGLVPLGDLARDVAGAIAPVAPGELRESDLTGLVPSVQERLRDAAGVVGLGFAAARGVMAGRDHYLYWFQRRPGTISRLNLNLAADDPDLYDYFDTDWFAGAERLQAPAIYGPYVDYAGADFLVLTAAVPVFVGDRFVGVAGADLDPDVLERTLVAMIRALPGDAVIVNADRSVLAAGSPRWMPGERLAIHPTRDRSQWLAVGALSSWTRWTLALATPEGA